MPTEKCVCVCVCGFRVCARLCACLRACPHMRACLRGRAGGRATFVRMRMRVRVRMCVCVCVLLLVGCLFQLGLKGKPDFFINC